MAMYWRKCLPVLGLALLVVTAGCGEDPIEEPDDEDEVCTTDQDCEDLEEGTPFCADPDRLQDADEATCVECMTDDNCDDPEQPYCAQGDCVAVNVCADESDCFGETPYCDQEAGECTDQPPAACQTDADCTGAQPYCHNETCVSEDLICEFQNCGGQRGVCNPDAGADGDCVNAEVCNSLGECTDDYKCVDNECQHRDDVCDCTGNEVCEHQADTLEVECVLDQVCDPNERWCEGNTLHICNSDGSNLAEQHCTEGCVEEGDEPTCLEPTGESCSAPFTLDDGETMQSWDLAWGEHTNNYDPDPDTGCVDDSDDLRTTGADVTFGAELEPGEVMVVELIQPLDYATLYMLDECGDSADSCTQPDGIVDEDHEDGWIRAIWYENDGDDTEDVHIVADTGIGASDQTAEANLVVSEQICNPGEDVCSEGLLGECSTYGTHFETDPQRECTDGCEDDDPAHPYCEPMDHSQCQDAQVFDPEQAASFSGEIIDFHSDGTFDLKECDSLPYDDDLEDEPAGPTAHYEVELQKGERLNAALASQFEATLRVVTDCGDGDCKLGVNQDEDMESFRYTSEEGGTYYVVVQAADEDVPHGSFTLDMSVDPPLCAEAEKGEILGCIEDDTLHVCDEDGSDFPHRYQCENNCEDGACLDPTGDRCLEARPLQLGTTHSGSFAALDDHLTPLSCSGARDWKDPVGPDAVYELELEDDQQLLDVELETISTDAGLYLMEDCPVLKDNTEDVCLDGAIPGGSQYQFFVEDRGTYYLVVDSADRFDPADFDLTVEADDAICLPGSTRCDGGDVQLCVDDGDEWETDTPCAVDCDSDDLVCTGPDDESDWCGDETHFIDDSGRIVDDFDRHSDQENLVEDEGGCFETGAPGKDTFYEFELAEMQGVNVEATVELDDEHHDLGLYLAEGCVRGDDVDCDETVEFGGTGTVEENLTFFSADGGTFVLGLTDLGEELDAAPFVLDFEFFDGECVPDVDDTCDDSTLVRCNKWGEETETTCAYGCDDSECQAKEGDFCDRPYPLDDDDNYSDGEYSLSIEDNIGEFSDGYDPYVDGDSCIDGAQGEGPDAVVSFQGWHGDELSVELETEYDGALWLTTDCEQAADQCVAGTYEEFGPGLETLDFTLDRQADYVLVADSVQAGATGDFELDVTLEEGPREDDPTIEISDHELSWDLEIEESETDQIDISNLGDMDLEFDIEEELDWLEVSPESDTVSGGETETVDVTAECGDEPDKLGGIFEIESNDPSAQTVAVEVELDCWEAATLSADVKGLDPDTDFQIHVVDNETLYYTFEQGDVETELRPGSYSLEPQEATQNGTTYRAGDTDVDLDHGETSEILVDYEPFSELTVTVEGLGDVDDPDYEIDVVDDSDDSVAATLTPGELTTELPHGDYTLEASTVEDGSDDELTTYNADDVDDVTLESDQEEATVAYEPIDSELTVTVEGLDEIDDHDYEIDVVDGDDTVYTFEPDDLTTELPHGTYTLEASTVEDGSGDELTTYDADVDDVTLESDHEEATVEYEPIDSELTVTVDGFDPEDAEFDIDIVDEDGPVTTLDQDNLSTELEHGEYTLEPDEEVEIDDTTYVSDGNVDVTIESDHEEAIVEYEPIDSELTVHIDGFDPEDAEFDIDIVDEDGPVTTLDQDNLSTELEHGEYTLEPDEEVEIDDTTYVSDGNVDVTLESDHEEATVKYEEDDDGENGD